LFEIEDDDFDAPKPGPAEPVGAPSGSRSVSRANSLDLVKPSAESGNQPSLLLDSDGEPDAFELGDGDADVDFDDFDAPDTPEEKAKGAPAK
jgi:hypothetical protein